VERISARSCARTALVKLRNARPSAANPSGSPLGLLTSPRGSGLPPSDVAWLRPPGSVAPGPDYTGSIGRVNTKSIFGSDPTARAWFLQAHGRFGHNTPSRWEWWLVVRHIAPRRQGGLPTGRPSISGDTQVAAPIAFVRYSARAQRVITKPTSARPEAIRAGEARCRCINPFRRSHIFAVSAA
jgi:hypothetical protein